MKGLHSTASEHLQPTFSFVRGLFITCKGKGKGESHVRFRTLGEWPLEGHLS